MKKNQITENSYVMNTKTGKAYKLHGLIVNLSDYNVGADKGGAINMFDDFDIDYNQMKYLIETRCSGALIKPFSAIALYADTQTKRTSKIVGDEGFKAADLIGS